LTGTPVAGLIVIHPGVEFKSIKGKALLADGDLGQMRPHLRVKAVAIHAEIERGIPKSNEAWHRLKIRMIHAVGGSLMRHDRTPPSAHEVPGKNLSAWQTVCV
jgi:hypothetical protein